MIMKSSLLIVFTILFSSVSFSQEFRFYINGTPFENVVTDHFKKGDLFRIVFINKNTTYQFKIDCIVVTLTPIAGQTDKNIVINQPTKFIISNPSDRFSVSPNFMFDPVEKLDLLRYKHYDVSIKIQMFTSNTRQGNEWIKDNVVLKEETLKRQALK